MSANYNYAGVRTYTDPRYLYTILTTELSSIFDVEVLALSFNMDKAELIGRQIGVDGFGTIDEERLQEIFADDPNTTYTPFTEDELNSLKSISGLMVDSDWFMIFDNYYNMTEVYNPEGSTGIIFIMFGKHFPCPLLATRFCLQLLPQRLPTLQYPQLQQQSLKAGQHNLLAQ